MADRLKLLVVGCALALWCWNSHATEDSREPIPEWQIKGFAAALKDPTPGVLEAAIRHRRAPELFQKLGDAAASQAPRLVEIALSDPESFVRSAAARALGALGAAAGDQAARLGEALGDPDYIVRSAAAKALGALGAAAGDQAPRLVEIALGDPDLDVRSAAARALGALGAAAGDQAARLGEALGDPDFSVRSAAAEALGALGAAAGDQAPHLVEIALGDPVFSVRSAAAQALGALGAAAGDQATRLGEALGDPDFSVRSAAAAALGALGAAAGDQAPRLGKALGDPESFVRSAAARALGALGAAAGDQAAHLGEALGDPDYVVRSAAAEALGALGAAAGDQAPRLVEIALSDSDVSVRKAAAEALGALGAAAGDQSARLGESLGNPDFSVRAAAARALGAMGAAAGDQSARLGEALGDPDFSVRSAAAEALGALGAVAGDQSARLGEALGDPDFSVRSAAARALGALGAAAGDQAARLGDALGDPDLDVRSAAAEALGALGAAAADEAPRLGEALGDPSFSVRSAAAEALGALGAAAGDQVAQLGEALGDPDFSVRSAAAQALASIGAHGPTLVRIVLELSYGRVALTGELRFQAHFLGGGEPTDETLIAWLGRPAKRPLDAAKKDRLQAVRTLKTFSAAWPQTDTLPELRRDLADQIARIVAVAALQADDLPLLLALAESLSGAGSTYTAMVKAKIEEIEEGDRIDWRKVAGYGWVGHAVFWILLIGVYPHSPQVQAIFFWNPWIRRFVGLGYVGLALAWVPFLRAKLFAPFRELLLADADLAGFDAETYFPESDVKAGGTGPAERVVDAIPAIRGQVVLEGESGLGKTMFLRYLVGRSRRITVYLPAAKCEAGVAEAIQAKLHGPAADPRYLRNLIYAGAIDICIDGLNEVSAVTRAQVASFAESYFKGNIIIGTQPMEWSPPSTAKTFVLQPLTTDRIEAFLTSRKPILPEDTQVTGLAYEDTCKTYLQKAFSTGQSEATMAATRRALSNPMDLTTVAVMLFRGQQPDLFHLQEQQYQLMAEDYERVNVGHAFPLEAFSERVYEMRLNDETALADTEFQAELACMGRHKMMLSRRAQVDGQGSVTQWHFRHDKIMEFFIVQAFLGPANDRPAKHLSDVRFRGVYLLLALLLPVEQAEVLRERLIDHAVDSKDHSISDSFIQLLRERKAA